MMISPYFKRSEFACKCGCGLDPVDIGLNEILVDVREYFGKPVYIHSGNRCPVHNHNEGGFPTSYHKKCQASDIEVKDTHPDEVADYLEKKYPNKYGIGRYRSFTHIDNRTRKARWDYR